MGIIHFPLQMTSEVRVPTEQRETQGVRESRQRRSGNAREQHCGGVGGERVFLPCYPLRGPITEIADPVPSLTIWGGGNAAPATRERAVMQKWTKRAKEVTSSCVQVPYCSHSWSGTQLIHPASLHQVLSFTGSAEDTLFRMVIPVSSPVLGIQ